MSTKSLWICVAILLSGCITPSKTSESGKIGPKDVTGIWVLDAKETQRRAHDPGLIAAWTQNTILTVHPDGTIERFQPVSYGDAYQKGSWRLDREGMCSTTRSNWGTHQSTYKLLNGSLHEKMEIESVLTGSKAVEVLIVYRRQQQTTQQLNPLDSQ